EGKSRTWIEGSGGTFDEDAGFSNNLVADITFRGYMETDRTLSFGGECIHVECNVPCRRGPMSISGQIRSVVQHHVVRSNRNGTRIAGGATAVGRGGDRRMVPADLCCGASFSCGSLDRDGPRIACVCGIRANRRSILQVDVRCGEGDNSSAYCRWRAGG